MIIKQSNLTSCLTHIAEALTTLNNLNDYEQGLFHSYVVEQLQEAVAALAEANEANEPEEELNELTPEEQLERLKSDVALFVVTTREQVSDLCNILGYHDGSKLSHVIDRMELMESDLNECEIAGH